MLCAWPLCVACVLRGVVVVAAAVVGSLVDGLNSLAASLPIVGTAAAAVVVLFNVYKQVQFNKVRGHGPMDAP